QDPDAVAKSAHPLAHAGEARSAQVGTGADEGDDARVVVLLEHLPQGPAPEVDVVVVEVLEVPPQTAGAGGFQEVLRQSALAAAGSFAGSQSLAEAHPAAFTLDAVVVGVDLLTVIGRVADTDENRHLCLHLLSATVLVAQR